MSIKVKVAPRFLNRKTASAKSIFKCLTEPITNSDDSYTRLADKGVIDLAEKQMIEIIYDTKSRTFKIIDYAEGMTDKDMKNKFEEYGRDTSGSSEGFGVRGLFGQGVSDVLFYHQKGHILSIVDNVLYVCKFRVLKDGTWDINPKRTKTRVDKDLYRDLRIPFEKNGTIISFELAPKTRKPIKNFINNLESFYMLRLIMSNENRVVYYSENNRNSKEKRTRLKYVFPEGQVLGEWEEGFDYEGDTVTALIQLCRSDSSLVETDENGLLVYDEKDAVYDRTFFGFPTNFPGAENLFGTVRLTGARSIILKKINQKKPEEILTDERNGFDTHHDFYKKLESVVKPHIESFIHKSIQVSKKDDQLPDKQEKSQREAFELLDNLYKNVIDESSLVSKPEKNILPPETGLQFDRTQINITEGKTYGLGLNINTALVQTGSVIKISTDNDKITIKPESFKVTEHLSKAKNLARSHISISGQSVNETGLIEASSEGKNSSVIATVVKNELVYPETMCFSPPEINIRTEKEGKANLFLNTNMISIGSEININSDSEEIVLEKKKFIVKDSNIVYEDVALIPIKFLTGKKATVNVIATHKDFNAKATIRVNDKQADNPTQPINKFSGWRFIETEAHMQCFYDNMPTSPSCGYLLVNELHPINKIYFGINPSKESVSKSIISQIYLAEIILNEILSYIFHEKWKQEKISGLNKLADEDPHLYIRQYLEAEKINIGPVIHKKFVDQALIEENKQTVLINNSVINIPNSK